MISSEGIFQDTHVLRLIHFTTITPKVIADKWVVEFSRIPGKWVSRIVPPELSAWNLEF